LSGLLAALWNLLANGEAGNAGSQLAGLFKNGGCDGFEGGQ
jgi:hypothetical protein